MASLREFARWAGLDALLPGYKLPTPGQAIPHPLPNLDKDIEAMLSCCKRPEQNALVALMGLEGLRLCEALELPPGHIDLKEMTIRVWGKGEKVRIIPLTNKAWPHLAPALIDAKLKHENRLVQYSDRGARHFITQLGVKAGVSRSVASHDLRHTFATCAYAVVKDLRIIQGWLGHADIATTQGYLDGNMTAMRSAGEF